MTLLELRGLLAAQTSDQLAVRYVLEEVLGATPSTLVLSPERVVSNEEARRALGLVEEFESGVPLQHVLGHWQFRGLDLIVDRRALIPRPETELLVETALRELDRARQLVARPVRALDLGTGSGAIAIALVRECHDVTVLATDLSDDALDLAALNAEVLSPSERQRLSFGHGDWFEAVDLENGPSGEPARYDVICSNPPYLSADEWNDLDAVVRDHDPIAALVGGETGTEQIERVVAGAGAHLVADGSLIVEIGWLQGPVALGLARAHGAADAEILRDLAGRDRILLARW